MKNFKIIIDRREQHFYLFKNIPWEWGTLQTGDYSIKGYENLVTVERKSIDDLFGTLSSGRERFFNEIERMKLFDLAVIMVESDPMSIIMNPPMRSNASPKMILSTLLSITAKSRIPVLFFSSRQLAKYATVGILRKWYESNILKSKS